MITPEYIEKLNEAIPEEGWDSGMRTALNLIQKVIASLSKGEEPPPLVDPSARTITVIAEDSWRVGPLLSWGAGSFVMCINDLLKAMGINIPDNELHYVWRYRETEAKIHLGEENIDRAIHEIGVKMVLTSMKAEILERVFDDCNNAECNYDLFGDPNDEDEDSYYKITIPTEVDLARVNEMFQQEAAKERQDMMSYLMQSVQERQISLRRMFELKENIWKTKIARVQSTKKQRMLLPSLKKTFLQNAEAMIAKERLTFDDTTSDENNSLFLSISSEVQNKILLYLGLQCANDLLHFGLASKSCYKIFRNVILVELGLKRQNTDGEEKIICIHDFDDIFEGMSLHSIASSYDELVWFDGDGGCEKYPPDSQIEIEKCNENQGEEKLTVKWLY